MMRRTFLLCCFIAASLQMISCNTAKKSAGSLVGLLNAKWTLQSVGGMAVPQNAFLNGMPQLEFNTAEGKVSGFTGCNRLNGPITLSGNTDLAFGPLMTTKMACNGVDESKFLSLLEKVNKFNIVNNKLQLYNDRQQLMELVKAAN